jgi:glycosyltransferase involved in cell wall biosynthesis
VIAPGESRDAAVTVVIPVWGRYCTFLPESVASILDQTGEPQRIIIVDNASEQPLGPLPDAVKVIRSARRLSVGAARNLALKEIETSTVMFLDADDQLLPGAIDFLRSKMAATPELVGCVGRHLSWDPATGATALLDRFPKPIVYRVAPHRRAFALANLRFNCFPIAGAILRTESVRDAGGFGDLNVGEDWILSTQLAFRGTFDFQQRPIFMRRVHAGSLWFRPHARSAYAQRDKLLRSRVRHDRAVPRWVKACLPMLTLVHHYDAVRATSASVLEPEHPFLQPKEATIS